ncbi:MAG: outer membrane protein assembly factor BamD, partial [Bacteroidales bacterium]|nr:outer membrane protein assembly factor BamD [Bacteroidales bacterium]
MSKKILILISVIMMLFSVSYARENQGLACQDKGKKTATQKRHSKRYKTKEEKLAAAKRYYEQGAYLSAAQLFEELFPLYVADPEGDTILFLFADSYLKNRDFLMAAYHFKDYVRRYPLSPNVEQASFLAAKCYFLNSPDYNVDQTDSKMAIESLQLFINTYPNGQYVEQSNAMI